MKKLILAAVFAVGSLNVHQAYAEEGTRGGGDPCESRIQEIRDDIASWIHKDGPKSLKLSSSLSTGKYSKAMLVQIEKAKIRCVAQGDSGFPVQVFGTAKTCRFDRSTSLSRITCDSEKFLTLTEDTQYSLVHHEFAGLAGIEIPRLDDSDYKISQQITGFLEDTLVKKLSVKAIPKSLPLSPNSQNFVDRIKKLFDDNYAIFNTYYAPACIAMKQACNPNNYGSQNCKNAVDEVYRRVKTLVSAQHEAQDAIDSGDYNDAFDQLYRFHLGFSGMRQSALGYFEDCNLQ